MHPQSQLGNRTPFVAVSFLLPALLLAAGLAAPLIAGILDLATLDSRAVHAQSRILAAVLSRTVAFAAISACAATLTAWTFALAIDSLNVPLRKALLTISVIPVVVHFLLRTYGLHILFGPKGPINAALMSSGLVQNSVPFTYSAAGTCLALTSWLLPISALFMHMAVRHVPSVLYDAAHSLGASPWATLKTVSLPQTFPAALLLFALNFALGYGTYLSPELLGGLEDVTVVRLIAQMLREGRSAEAAWFGTIATAIPVTLFVILTKVRSLALEQLS